MTDDKRGAPLSRRAQRLLEAMRDPPDLLIRHGHGVDGEWRRPGILPGFGRKTIHDLLEAGLIEPRVPPLPHEDNWFAWFRLTVPSACDPTLAASLIKQMVQFDGLMRNHGAPDTLWGLVLRHGVGRFGAPLPRGFRRRKPRRCFENAATLAMAADHFVYCEGYGVRPLMPVMIGLHAWVLDRRTGWTVVDTTWKRPATGFYLGIPFSTEFLIETLERKRHYGLIDNWEEGYPLMTAAPSSFLHVDAETIPHDFQADAGSS